MKRGLALLLLLMVWAVLSNPAPAWAEVGNGARLFEQHCAGCHQNGGNIVRRGKTLKLKALERNGVNSVEAIATLVANGKNNMSAYKDRLSSEEIAAVSAYVLQQAEQNWEALQTSQVPQEPLSGL